MGSLNTETAAESFEKVSQYIGESVKRIPDGEVGRRFHWILFQESYLESTKGLERVGNERIDYIGYDLRKFRIGDNVKPETIVIKNLGYADAAIDSYSVFKEFKDSGRIGDNVRFQVSLPTPVAVVSTFVVDEDKVEVEKIYEKALLVEIDRILEAVPEKELAIQFDIAVEFSFIESVTIHDTDLADLWYGEDAIEDATSRIARIAANIPAAVEVGVHLCYGDVAEKHFVEPKDSTNLTKVANSLARKFVRPLNWVHLPVPIERDDEDYFAPLRALSLSKDTELYLGLIHREDGKEGLNRRIKAAGSVLEEFGVATECGIGRHPKESIESVFKLHRV